VVCNARGGEWKATNTPQKRSWKGKGNLVIAIGFWSVRTRSKEEQPGRGGKKSDQNNE